MNGDYRLLKYRTLLAALLVLLIGGCSLAAAQGLTADFTANPRTGQGPLPVQFQDNSSGSHDRWAWSFGDGYTSTVQNPAHTYATPGNYTVTLTVYGGGEQSTATKEDYIKVTRPAPLAYFCASPLKGCPPLTVHFIDYSSGTIDTWFWEFGDGGTSTSQYPVHTYTKPGLYDVSLTVANSGGSNTFTQAHYIQVDTCCVAPVADFTANQTTGRAPLHVQFTDLSTGDPTSWSWNFGDGGTSTLRNPVHTYTAAGTYTVSLTVMNDCGSSQKAAYIQVTPCPPPDADFTANQTTGKAPLHVQFTDLSTGNPTSWAWDFGDGGTSTLRNPVHTYSTPGIFTVTLTVANECGADTMVKAGYIQVSCCPPPDADFTANRTTGNAPMDVKFTDLSTNGPTSWTWTFGDGSTSSDQNPVHTYTAAGTYTVNLTVANECGGDIASKPMYITVSPCPLPDANFTANQTTGRAPLDIQFTDLSTGSPISWAWSFGDGSSSSARNPIHTYTAAGTYTVSLTVTNECGADTSVKEAYIIVSPCPLPDANFTANQTTGRAPLDVQFTDLSTGSPVSWAWSFGDGSSSGDQNPVHTYTAAGTYTVSLTVTNECGGDTSVKEAYIIVSPCPLPDANFTANQTTGRAPLDVQFTDLSTGSPISWAWSFGDGSSSGDQNPVHTYTAAGTYTVSLTVTNECGADTYEKACYIQVSPCPLPDAIFVANQTTGRAPLDIQFTDLSTGSPISWAWNFGDNSTSGDQNPVHTYTAAGTYTVSLTVTNECGADTSVKEAYITVSPCPLPDANFTANQTTGRAPLDIQFTDLSTGSPVSWAWSFGDGSSSSARNPVHTYTAEGTYSVSLTVTNECGADTSVKEAYIIVSPCPLPDANFTANQTTGRAPLDIQFTDLSTGSPVSWAWSFGDGSSSSARNPVHTYTAEGTYTVSLTVTNECGADTSVKEAYIIVSPCPLPDADFTANQTTGRAPLDVQFTDLSTGSPISWAWSFGDGTTSESQNPVHRYTQFGTYTVSLTVTNECGADTQVKMGYIVVTPTGPVPHACFTMTPTVGYAPLTVTFIDLSQRNPERWEWDFGDGSTSTERNPVHVFTSEGKYVITLTVYSSGGSSTYSRALWVLPRNPPKAFFVADKTFGISPLTVHFTDSSLNSPTSWAWDFGEGNQSALQNPTHTFYEAGTYKVTLTVSNSAGNSSASRRILVRS
jgi:PKD repeat protein